MFVGVSFAADIDNNINHIDNGQINIQKDNNIEDYSKVNDSISKDVSTKNSLKKNNIYSNNIKNTSVQSKESTEPVNAKKIYVNLNIKNSKQDGTINNPYYSLNLAISKSVDKENIIYLNEGTYKLSNKNNILKNIKIIGSNREKTIINCNSNQGFRVYKGAKLSFENLTVTNANYSQGGVILLSSNSKLVINNCTFKNNKGNNGAVLFGSGANISANITNSKFESNTAVRFGAALQMGGYNSIYNVMNCTFINNKLTDKNYLHSTGGAAIYASAYSTVNVDNSVFKNNEAIWGNAILNGNHATLKISNSKFLSNIAIKNTAGTNRTKGGAIAIGSGHADILNCYFENNKADIGGAISVNSGETVKITSSIFQKNIAYYEAGAINNYGVLTIKNTSFIKNSATINGGALLDKGLNNILIDNCTFKDNRVSTINIVENQIPSGGAIFITSASSQFNIKNTIFDHNSAYRGGAIYSNKFVQWINIINNKYHNNTACCGGAMVITGETTVNVEKSSFTYNRAVKRGGAIQILGLIQGNFLETTFKNNVVNQSSDCNGGVISIEYYSRLGFSFCNFENNYANKNGGTIYSSSVVNMRIIESNMINNTATLGSVLYIDNSKNYRTFKSQIILDGTSLVNNNGKYILYSKKIYNESGNYNIIRACWFGSNYVPKNVTSNFKILNYVLLTITINDINIETNWLKSNLNVVVNRTKNVDKNLLVSTATIKENNNYRYTDAFLPSRKFIIKENNNREITKNLYVYYHLNMDLNSIVIKMDNQKITIKIVD